MAARGGGSEPPRQYSSMPLSSRLAAVLLLLSASRMPAQLPLLARLLRTLRRSSRCAAASWSCGIRGRRSSKGRWSQRAPRQGSAPWSIPPMGASPRSCRGLLRHASPCAGRSTAPLTPSPSTPTRGRMRSPSCGTASDPRQPAQSRRLRPQCDWLLSLDFPSTALVTPVAGGDSTRIRVEATGGEVTLRFRPRYYQKHRGLAYYQPWTYHTMAAICRGLDFWFAYRDEVTEADVHSAVDAIAERLAPFGYELRADRRRVPAPADRCTSELAQYQREVSRWPRGDARLHRVAWPAARALDQHRVCAIRRGRPPTPRYFVRTSRRHAGARELGRLRDGRRQSGDDA